MKNHSNNEYKNKEWIIQELWVHEVYTTQETAQFPSNGIGALTYDIFFPVSQVQHSLILSLSNLIRSIATVTGAAQSIPPIHPPATHPSVRFEAL